MRLGEILVARGIVTLEGIEQAAEHQRTNGGRLGDNLIALGLLTQEQLESVMHETPRSPKTIMGTGLSQANITSLILKFMYVEQLDTISKLIDRTKLPYNIVKIIVDDLVGKKYTEVLGSASADGSRSETRYSLSNSGREMGSEAAEQNVYMGPCPVSLEQYQDQILKQRITNEVTDEETIRECFEGLIIPDHFLAQIGPAVNSGRTLLMYGPPGNGKTDSSCSCLSSRDRRIGIFGDVRHAVEVRDFAVQHVAHEEVLRQSNATQLGRRGDRSGHIHDDHSPCFQPSWLCHAGAPLASMRVATIDLGYLKGRFLLCFRR